jgi:hypothetical protein
MADEPGDTGESTFDLDAGVASIASDIFDKTPEPAADATPDTPETPVEPAAVAPPVSKTPDAPTVRPAPKAWPKEMHEHWSKLDPKVHEYLETREKQMLDGLGQYKTDAQFGKTLRDVVAPFKPIIQAAGLDEAKAVQYLLNAHYQLTQGTPQQRQAAYQKLGKDMGLTAADPNAAPVDPAIQAIQDRLTQFESSVLAQQQASLTDAQAKVAKEVELFASDPAHADFDELADDITAIIKAKGVTLQEAYDQAKWLNPVARAKEIARVQTEHEAKLRENARLEALPKKKAAGVNVRSRETESAPTEPLGTMEDTMRSKLREMKERVH